MGSGSVCVSCGGGVYSWSGRDRVVLEGGNIVNNTAHRQGGGVYVSHAPWSITIKNALITANTAAIQGGGIWSCPKGHGKPWHGCGCIWQHGRQIC